RPFATAIPTLAAASSGEAATGLPKEPENPIAHRRGHVSQVRSPRFQLSVHLPPEFRAIARRSFASGSKALICMDDLVSRPSRSPDRCELRHVSAIRFPAGCPVRLAGCWRQAGGGRV